MEDTELSARAREGDREAFAELIRRHYASMVGLCASMLGASRAEDACQDVFLRAFEAIDGFQGESAFGTWLHRIAANRCLDILRQEARKKQDSLDAIEEESPGALDRLLALPDEAALSAEQSDLIERVLGRLTPEQRLLLTLREVQGLSYDELSDTLGCTLDAVKSRLKRARQTLAEITRHFSAREDV